MQSNLNIVIVLAGSLWQNSEANDTIDGKQTNKLLSSVRHATRNECERIQLILFYPDLLEVTNILQKTEWFGMH